MTALYPSPELACQGGIPGQINCDRSDASYRNHVATLASPTSCPIRWEYQNKGTTSWSSWSATFGIYTCKDGWRPRKSPQTGCEPVDETNTAQLPQPKPKSSCGHDPNPGLGDPIYPLTGALKENIATGLRVGGIELVLNYDTTSKAQPSESVSNFAPPNSFGPLWQTNFHRKLLVYGANESALLSRGDGVVLHFSGGAGGFVASGGSFYRLTATPGGYLFADVLTGALEQYDSAGRLLKLEDASGAVLTFSYNPDGTPATVVDGDDRRLRFEYSTGRITKIIGSDGGTVTPSYDAAGNLQALKWQDGKSLTFQYENPALTWAMTGKTDENGQRIATFTFDANGRAVGVEGPDGTDRYTVSYASPPILLTTENYDSTKKVWRRTMSWQAASGIVVTGPNQQASEFNAQVIGGMPYLTAKSQPAGSGCAASTSQQSYDAKGRVLSHDRFDGSRVCYAYDATGRETVRVEGLASSVACDTVTPEGAPLPLGARRISTTWHPDWELVTVQEEALRRTTYVYNGQPDPFANGDLANCTTAPVRADGKPLPVLCKKVVQAKLPTGGLDPSVASRSDILSYDAKGRVLTRTDGNSHTTTYGYYTDTQYTSTDVSGESDPDFDKVQLLLRANGTNGSKSFLDSSPIHASVTAGGNAQLSTSESRFGGASAAFDGSGDYLSVPYSAGLSPGGSDFTVEAWIYPRTLTAGVLKTIASKRGSAGNEWEWGAVGPDLALTAWGAGGAVVVNFTGTVPLTMNAWQHVAVTRSASTWRLFVNGSLAGTSTETGALAVNSSALDIGRDQVSSARDFNGFIDDLRITKGRARYIGDFTPSLFEAPDKAPTASLEDVGHASGDLQSIRNPVGHVTEIVQYDRAGRVREMRDRKGVLTQITYTPRGQVSTISTTPGGGAVRVSTYTYDDAGQLTGIDDPDGTHIGLGYDAAHRLTSVTDTRGNSVIYTLDAMGNRTGEDVKDATGLLRRSIARSFDALNRLQQVTGAAE